MSRPDNFTSNRLPNSSPRRRHVALALVAGLFAGCAGDDAPNPPEYVVELDPMANEFPDGVALHDGYVYLGIATQSRVIRWPVDGGGSAEEYATLPALPPEGGFLLGLAAGADGALFAALASFDPAVPAGVYRVPPGGGEGTLFAAHPDMVLPNGLAFDDAGRLYVTDPIAGAVFAIDPDGPDGTAERFATGELLTGDSEFCGEPRLPFPAGANGIGYHQGALYVSNTDRGAVVRVPIASDRTAGEITTVAGPDCDRLAGADGLAVDRAGTIYVALNFVDRIARVSTDGVEDVPLAGLAEEPASLMVAEDDDALYWTNFPILRFGAGQPARPGLVRVALD